MRFSNNYAKYIEELKLEKNKKAFQKTVESTKEVKVEKIIYEESASSKKSDSIVLEDTPDKKGDSSIFVEHDLNKRDGDTLDSNIPYVNTSEYGSIQNTKELKPSEKNRDKIYFDLNSDYSTNSKSIKNVDSDSNKEGGELKEEEAIGEKTDTKVEQISDASSKLDNFLIYEYALDGKNEIDTYSDESHSSKDDIKIYDKRDYSEKNPGDAEEVVINLEKENSALSDYIEKIKEEKTDKSKGVYSSEDYDNKKNEKISYTEDYSDKDPRKVFDKKDFNRKKDGKSDHFIAKPIKDETKRVGVFQRQLGDYDLFGYDLGNLGAGDIDKAREEQMYETNASKFGYYPFGTYSQQESIQSGAIDDAFARIISPDNWSNTGKSIVNSLKVATDIVDMINLVGPSANIHTSKTANRLRWDLRLGTSDGDNLNGTFYSGIWDKTYQGDFKYLEDKFKEQGDEDGNLANKSSDKTNKGAEDNDKKVKALNPDDNGGDDELTEFVDNKSSDKDSGKNKTNLENKFKEQGDNDGNLANEPGSKERLEHAWDVRAVDPENHEEVITEFAYAKSSANSESNRWYDFSGSLGKIYVIPPYRNLAKTALENNESNKVDVAFTIPLQNNLQFEQTSRAAAWTAIQFFGRIGDVQQYSRTGSMEAMSLTTDYFVDDDEYTMARLQDIEMKYRSLVLPAEMSAEYLNGGGNTNRDSYTYYYFTRPPLINIVLGNSDGRNQSGKPIIDRDSVNSGAYKNLFTDIITSYTPDGTRDYEHDIYYKNFVVTNVSIDKNQSDHNYYVVGDEKEGDYFDTMGFKVTLTVIEIDGNYLGSMPSFNSYYNTLASRGQNK